MLFRSHGSSAATAAATRSLQRPVRAVNVHARRVEGDRRAAIVDFRLERHAILQANRSRLQVGAVVTSVADRYSHLYVLVCSERKGRSTFQHTGNESPHPHDHSLHLMSTV